MKYSLAMFTAAVVLHTTGAVAQAPATTPSPVAQTGKAAEKSADKPQKTGDYEGVRRTISKEDLEKGQKLLELNKELVDKGIVRMPGRATYVPPSDLPPEEQERLLNKVRAAAADTIKIPERPNFVDPSKPKPETPEPITALTPSMRKLENNAISAELVDGQNVLFRENGYVSIVDERGRYITPPDGVLTLRDGTTFTVKDGLRVDQ